jgi:hypothetical protein
VRPAWFLCRLEDLPMLLELVVYTTSFGARASYTLLHHVSSTRPWELLNSTGETYPW